MPKQQVLLVIPQDYVQSIINFIGKQPGTTWFQASPYMKMLTELQTLDEFLEEKLTQLESKPADAPRLPSPPDDGKNPA